MSDECRPFSLTIITPKPSPSRCFNLTTLRTKMATQESKSKKRKTAEPSVMDAYAVWKVTWTEKRHDCVEQKELVSIESSRESAVQVMVGLKKECLEEGEDWEESRTDEVDSSYQCAEIEETSVRILPSQEEEVSSRPKAVFGVVKTTQHTGKGWLGVGHFDYDEEIVELVGVSFSKKEAEKWAEDEEDDGDSIAKEEDDDYDQDEVSFSIAEFAWG